MPLGSAAGLPLVGVNSRFAMLRGSRRVVLVRLSDGKLISLAHRKPLVAVRLSDKGLFYAYNVQSATKKGRIAFEPTARLMARF